MAHGESAQFLLNARNLKMMGSFFTPTNDEESSTSLKHYYDVEFDGDPQMSLTSLEMPASHSSLHKFLVAGYIAVLDQAVDEMIILGNIQSFPVDNKDISYKTVAEKFSEPYKTYLYDPKTIDAFGVMLVKQKMAKFQRDRHYLETVLAETLVEMQIRQSFDILLQRNKEYQQMKDEENAFLKEAERNKKKARQMRKTAENEKIDYMIHMEKISKLIAGLKDEIEEVRTECNIKQKYIKGWENARVESNNIILTKSTDYYSNQIKFYTSEIEREERVHEEVESFIKEATKEAEDEILMWMEKYDSEVETRDMEIQILKEKQEDQLIKLESLAKLYDKHKQEIAEFLVVKKQRRQEQEKLERMVQATTRIQSWWRGIMVRKCLGPYSKKKKGKGKKDKKGSGKGKKKGK